MKTIKEFVEFVKKERWNEAIDMQRKIYNSMSIDYWNKVAQEKNEELNQIIKYAFLKTLAELENSDATKFINDDKDQWQLSRPADVSDLQAFFADITNIAHIQKKALLQLIPEYTKEVQVATDIALEIENFSNNLQLKAVEAFQKMQEKAINKIKKSDENYKDLFDNAHDLIHIIKPDGSIMYVNNAWLEKLEYTKEELKGKTIFSLIDEKDRALYQSYRNSVLQKNNLSRELTFTLISKSNKPVTVQGFISAKFKNDQPVFTRGIFRDITIQVQYEQKLKLFTQELMEREENLQQIINHAPDAVIVIDEKGMITLWNPKAEEIFGWQKEDVLGKQISTTIIPPIYREAHHNGINRYLTTGEVHVLNKTIEITALNKKGQEFLVSLTISATKQDGQTAFISFIRDISTQRKTEQELQQQKIELEQSNRELEQYTWLTSHDLREPLRKVLTFSDMLLTRERHLLNEAVLQKLYKIKDAGIRMNKLIASVLQYSTLTDDSSLFQETDLNDIVEEVINDLELFIEENNVALKLHPLPTIEAVPFQMQQLFLNLIGNAIKYRKPDTDPIITIDYKCINATEIEIIIKDNGTGFNMINKEKIFKLFQRLDAHQKSGTGIGLALCKKIVQNHKGHITVYSEEGMGTTFFIQLPIKRF